MLFRFIVLSPTLTRPEVLSPDPLRFLHSSSSTPWTGVHWAVDGRRRRGVRQTPTEPVTGRGKGPGSGKFRDSLSQTIQKTTRVVGTRDRCVTESGGVRRTEIGLPPMTRRSLPRRKAPLRRGRHRGGRTFTVRILDPNHTLYRDGE